MNKKKTKRKKIIKRKIKKKRNNKSYFTLDSVKHSLHIFYFGTRFTLAMQLLQEFNLFQSSKFIQSPCNDQTTVRQFLSPLQKVLKHCMKVINIISLQMVNNLLRFIQTIYKQQTRC